MEWGGVIFAGHVNASFKTESYCSASWDAESQTMTWNGIWTAPAGGWGSWYFVLTQLPAGDITSYKKFHATLSEFSDNVDYVLLRFKQGDNNYADAKLVAGENNIDLVALAEANPGVDFTKIDDITIWGANEAVDGKSINGENPASVKIENVYLETPQNITTASLNEEITDINYLTDGGTFVIAHTDGKSIQTWKANEAGAAKTELNNISTDLYYCLTIEELPELDIDGKNGTDDATYYRIAIKNTSGTAKPSAWWGDNYVNIISWGDLWSTSCDAVQSGQNESYIYGRDGDFNAVWTIAYEEGKGFKFFNPKTEKYMKLSNTTKDEYFVKLHKGITINVNTELDKENNAANGTIFDFSNATGYDAETGTITNGGWTFATPVDISNWDYLVITTIDNSSDGSRIISITDNDGNSVKGNQYVASVAGTGKDMYLDRWNNQNAICISIDYLRINKGLDVSKIKSLTFANNDGNGDCILRISNVYLTDYNNPKITTRGEWTSYVDGDVVREYNAEGVGKYGTICLPYTASCSGAEIYSIVEANSAGITLEKVTGLLEAGKPYFYMASDEIGKDYDSTNKIPGTVRNVNFFRADLDTYDVDEPIANNGLIGTFTDITAPQGEDFYVLSGNKLYDTAGSTVNVGANKAYIDMSQIFNQSSEAKNRISIDFGNAEATGIESVNDIEALNSGKMYDLSGREVTNPTSGIYIMGGKKIIIK